MLPFIFTSVSLRSVFWYVSLLFLFLRNCFWEVPNCPVPSLNSMFHFNSEDQFAAHSAVTIGALSITWLGHTFLHIGSIFCFFKKQGANQAPLSMTLPGWRLSTLTASSQHPTALSLQESTFFKEELSSLKDTFFPLFYQMKVQAGLWE